MYFIEKKPGVIEINNMTKHIHGIKRIRTTKIDNYLTNTIKQMLCDSELTCREEGKTIQVITERRQFDDFFKKVMNYLISETHFSKNKQELNDIGELIELLLRVL